MFNIKFKAVSKHIFLIIFGIIMIYPILWLFLSSFKENSEIFSATSFLPKAWRLENYVNGWNSVPGFTFGTFFVNSLILVFLIVIGSIISTTMAAYPFARLNFPFKNLLFAILMGTLMLPGQILLIPRYLLFTKLEWINTIKPMTVPAFLGQVSGAFFIYLMIQFMRGIPKELDEASIMDGCGHIRIFWNVMLPNCKPAIFTVGIFAFIWSWDNFLDQLLYLNDVRKYTVALALRMFMDNAAQINWGSLFAMSFLSVLPCLLIFAFAQKYFVEGIATTGLK